MSKVKHIKGRPTGLPLIFDRFHILKIQWNFESRHFAGIPRLEPRKINRDPFRSQLLEGRAFNGGNYGGDKFESTGSMRPVN